MKKYNKKVLITIVGIQFQIYEGVKHRIDSFINSYIDQGYEVDILLFYSLNSIPYLLKKRKYLNNNANWILYPTFTIERFKFLSYLTDFFSQIIFAIYSRIRKYDLIQFELSGTIGRYRRSRSFCIIDFHSDLFSETIYRYNNRETWRSKKALDCILSSLKAVDFVILVSEKLKLQIEHYSQNRINNYSIISCGADINRFKNAEVPASKVFLENKVILGYCGGLQKWQNIDVILDIILAIKKQIDDVFFLLITNDDTSLIEERLSLLGEDHYKTVALKGSEVPSFLKLLDVGFLIRDNISLNIVSSPTKMVEYLAAGVPVICTKYSGDYERSIKNGQNGFILDNVQIQNYEINNLVDFIGFIKNNREKVRQSCIDEAQKRSWNIEFKAFLDKVNKN